MQLAPNHVGVWKKRKWVKDNCYIVQSNGELAQIESLGELVEGARVVFQKSEAEAEIFLYDFTENRVFLERVKN